MVVQMEAEDVSNEVRQYSILVGFLLIIIFVVPCVGFALFSKYCQKQTRRKRVSHNTTEKLDCVSNTLSCTMHSVHVQAILRVYATSFGASSCTVIL